MKGYIDIYNLINNKNGEITPFYATLEQLVNVFNKNTENVFCIEKSILTEGVLSYEQALDMVLNNNNKNANKI